MTFKTTHEAESFKRDFELCSAPLVKRIEALEAGQPQSPPDLIPTCQKSLPGGAIDDTTYSQIEDALDEIDAPMTAPDGRFFTLVERIKSLSVSRPDRGSE